MKYSNISGIQMRVAVIAMGTLLLAVPSFASAVVPAAAAARVPEPAMLLMLGAGLAGLGVLRARLKK
jgi:PEP-CTERM motif